MTIRGVLFDLDGVLIDSYEAWFSLTRAAAEDLGYAPPDRKAFAAMWGQGISADVENLYTRHTVEEIERYYDAHFPRHLDAVAVDPDAAPLFRSLRRRNLRLGVVTNTPSPLARTFLEKAGLHPDALAGGTDVKEPKPAPDLVLLALQRLDVLSSEAILVGDSRFDREAAEAAGVTFWGYRTAGDRRVESLPEVAEQLGASV